MFGKKSKVLEEEEKEELVEEEALVDEEPEEVVESKVEAEEDGDASSCPMCKGEGLKNEREICPECLGTGKRVAKEAEFPDGTMQLRPGEGAFVMKGGVWVKKEE